MSKKNQKYQFILVVEGQKIDLENFYDDLKRIRDKNHVVFLTKEVMVFS